MQKQDKNGSFGSNSRTGTISWLSEQAYADKDSLSVNSDDVNPVWEKAKAALKGYTEPESFSLYAIKQPYQGEIVDRGELLAGHLAINYTSYNPPPLWGAPYSLFKIRIGKSNNDDFVHHTGEGILRPIQGAISFQVIWSPPSGNPQLLTREDFTSRSIIRINPQIPHRVWSGKGDSSEAWLIVRDGNNSPATFSVSPEMKTGARSHGNSRITSVRLENIKDYGDYALRAWGLLEHIRTHRLRAGLSSMQLGQLCGINSSQMSRIENGTTNVNLATLIHIASVLHIPIEALIKQSSWYCKHQTLEWEDTSTQPHTFNELVEPTGLSHHLLPYCLQIRYLSIIVQSGEVKLMAKRRIGGKSFPESLHTGSVAHFRGKHFRLDDSPGGRGKLAIEARADTELMVIACTTD